MRKQSFFSVAAATRVVVGFHLPQQECLKGSEGETHMMNISHGGGWNEWEDKACDVGDQDGESVLS